jgi:hypothetical protein
MIQNRGRRGRLRPLWWVAFTTAVGVMVLGGAALADGWVRDPVTPLSAGSPSASPSASPSPSPSASPPVPAPAADRLQVPGAVPTKGTGRFTYAPGRGPVLGRAGPLRTFRVAVEHRTGVDVTAFAAVVEATLGDRRSWTSGNTLRLQRVAPGDPANFTIYLATRTTAGRLCRAGGLNITVGGVPFTSCRTTGRAIINLDRWEKSGPPYVAAKVPLKVYRTYVINHEVGHELGHSHEGCPKKGEPAPVMVQQTLTLRGCVPNAWPRPGRRFLSGPLV